jgi:hypothetical protein
VAVVVVLFTVVQPPPARRWIFTGTFDTHAEKASVALTWPRATRCLRRLRVTDRACSTLTVKLAVLVTVPPGVVTLILPVVAPVGTVAVIDVAELTVNVAVTLLNFTEVVVQPVPLKFVPVIVTFLPTGPKVGVNEVIVGAGTGVTVKFVALARSPAAVYTWIGPVVAPVGTTAVTDVALVVVGVTRPDVLKRTAVGAVVKVPLIVTVEPTTPLAGENVGTPGHVALGPVEYVKAADGPSLLVTMTLFEALAPASAGIVASSWVSESIETIAPASPPNVTTVAGPPFATVWKFDPMIVTLHPGEAVLGVTDVMVGTAA